MPRLTNRRGAALLLVIYMASLLLLYLGGVGLQRTATDLRAAELSRHQLQAFYLAEGGLDGALQRLAADINAVPDRSPRTVTTPLGQATYTVTTTSQPGERPITRRINAVGTRNGAQQEVRVDISEPDAPPPLQGLVTGGRIYLFGPVGATGPTQYMQVYGTVHAGGGNIYVMGVDRTKINGAVSVGLSRPDPVDWLWPQYSGLYGRGIDMSTFPPGWAGPPPGGGVAGIQMYPYHADADHFVTAPTVQATLVPDITEPTYGVRVNDPIDQALQQGRMGCGGDLFVGEGQQRVIGDGDPLDLTGAGDGKVAVCVNNVSLAGALQFTAPATLYVTGSNYFQGARGSLQAVAGGSALTNGVEVVMPRWANSVPAVWGYAGRFALEDWYPPRISVEGGTFHGSIWAPYAQITLRSNRDAGDLLEPVNVFGYITRVYGASTREVFRFGSDDTQTGTGTPAKPLIRIWSN